MIIFHYWHVTSAIISDIFSDWSDLIPSGTYTTVFKWGTSLESGELWATATSNSSIENSSSLHAPDNIYSKQKRPRKFNVVDSVVQGLGCTYQRKTSTGTWEQSTGNTNSYWKYTWSLGYATLNVTLIIKITIISLITTQLINIITIIIIIIIDNINHNYNKILHRHSHHHTAVIHFIITITDNVLS